jgi:hypothetical protein
MSKLVGASFIALGTGGIALALLKDTKYDILLKLGITKPKITSKIQQDFQCEVLFLKISSNFFASFEIQKQINQIKTQQLGIAGVKVLNQAEKDRIAELEIKKAKATKIYTDSVAEFNSSICGSEMNVMDCVQNGNCLKTTEYSNDCIKNAIAYFEEFNAWTDIEKDLTELSDSDFQKKYSTSSKDPKGYYRKTLPSKKANLEVLKKAYDNCDVANVDCASLKEDIDTLKQQYETYKANPDSSRLNSPARANMQSAKSKLDIKQKLFDKTTCGSNQIVRTGVNYKDVRDCVELDEIIKSYKEEILFREKKKLELGQSWTASSETILSKFKAEVVNLENDFINKGCRARLESQKLKDNAIMLTDMASQQEKNILLKNMNEQYIYIGTGALVLLSGFYMVLKK